MNTFAERGGGAQPASTGFAHHPAIAAALAMAAAQDNTDAAAPAAPAPDHRVLREQIEAGYAMVGALLPPTRRSRAAATRPGQRTARRSAWSGSGRRDDHRGQRSCTPTAAAS